MKTNWYTRIVASYGALGPGHKDSMTLGLPPGFPAPDTPVKVYEGFIPEMEIMERFLQDAGLTEIPSGAKYRVEHVFELAP